MPGPPYILIADDDPDDQEMLADRLRRRLPDARFEFVANGKDALSWLENCPPGLLPQLIVVDYKMPILTGFEFLQSIQNDGRFEQIPKVVWSTSGNREFVDKCMRSGARDYFVKPNDVRELDHIVDRLSGLFQ